MFMIACGIPLVTFLFWPVVLVLGIVTLTAGLSFLVNALISPYRH